MGNMFCSPKISASAMNVSEGSASFADEQPKDFILGFTTSLGNKSSGLSPSEFISNAWFEAKGYDMPEGWTSLHYDKARSRYIKHTNAYAFNAQNINDVFKLSGPAASDMKNLSKQQTDIGAAAHAVLVSVEQLEHINVGIEDLKQKLSSKQPSLDELNEVLSSFQQSLGWDVGKPLGSATRILAGLFNSITKSRRKICLDTLRDDRAKQAFERVPLSEDALFGEDLDAVLARMKHISQLNLSNNRTGFSYVPTQPFQPQPRAASTSYSFQKGSKQALSKSKSSRNFKDNFSNQKGNRFKTKRQ